MTHREFRTLQNQMDQAGLLTVIKTIRSGARWEVVKVKGSHPEVGEYFKEVKRPRYVYRYEVIINGQLVMCYKCRSSAKKYLIREFEKRKVAQTEGA